MPPRGAVFWEMWGLRSLLRANKNKLGPGSARLGSDRLQVGLREEHLQGQHGRDAAGGAVPTSLQDLRRSPSQPKPSGFPPFGFPFPVIREHKKGVHRKYDALIQLHIVSSLKYIPGPSNYP